ncbi:MAG: glycosyltransferase [Bacteroides sp.]|nr:glycosyltransferase [Bacteroides sp.]
MPVHNGADYLNDAIDSVLNQTFPDWELIIVDDGSTDQTPEIIQDYCSSDFRIRSIRRDRASGGANIPRLEGIAAARGELIAPLDADDVVMPDYLGSLLSRMKSSGAEIVYPIMVDLESEKRVITYSHEMQELADGKISSLPGKSCVKHTLDGWRMGCNGGVIKKEAYERVMQHPYARLTYSCADELLTRALLLEAKGVTVTDTKYLYRRNPESVTRRKSIDIFNYLRNNRELLKFTDRNFGQSSEEYLLAQKQNFHGVADAYTLIAIYGFSQHDRAKAFEMIDSTRKLIDFHLLKGRVSRHLYRILKWRWLPALSIFRLRHFLKS